jgi:hypothetical protein
MCWNAKVSLASLIVGISISLGVAFIAFQQKKWSLFALSLAWIWPILMQYIDLKIWNNTCKEENRKITWLGYVLNVMAPIGLYFVFILFPNPIANKLIASALILIYIFYMIYSSRKVSNGIDYLDNTPGTHIEYTWWKYMKYGGPFYIIAVILIFLLLVRPKKMMTYTLGYVLITLAISSIFFKYGLASMWCWFAVITPLVALWASK